MNTNASYFHTIVWCLNKPDIPSGPSCHIWQYMLIFHQICTGKASNHQGGECIRWSSLVALLYALDKQTLISRYVSFVKQLLNLRGLKPLWNGPIMNGNPTCCPILQSERQTYAEIVKHIGATTFCILQSNNKLGMRNKCFKLQPPATRALMPYSATNPNGPQTQQLSN